LIIRVTKLTRFKYLSTMSSKKSSKMGDAKRRPSPLRPVKFRCVKPFCSVPEQKRALGDKKQEIAESLDQDSPVLFVSASLAKSMTNPNVVYPFRLVAMGSFTSSIGGAIAGYVNFDPSVSSEWTALTTLFDQVRGVRNKITIANIDPHADGYATGPTKNPYYIACDQGKNSSTPTSALQVMDCPDARTFHSASTRVAEMDYKYPKSMNWAPIATPATAPDIGCYGEWQIYGGGFTGSTQYLVYVVEFFVEFRSRT
jgi:hypothetical protein